MKTLPAIVLSSMILVGCQDVDKVEKETIPLATAQSESIIDEFNYSDEELRDAFVSRFEQLLDSNLTFHKGTYPKGVVPKGTYAVVNVVYDSPIYVKLGKDIEHNFESFGYVSIDGETKVDTNSYLINVEAFDKLGVSGVRDIFNIITGTTVNFKDYNSDGMYAVGYDLDEGSYVVSTLIFDTSPRVYVYSDVDRKNIVQSIENLEESKITIDVKKGQFVDVKYGVIYPKSDDVNVDSDKK